MGDVVNFNRARKAKARADAKTTAEANRAKFGRAKEEKARDRIERERAAKVVDGAKLEKD
ncbi:MULTISPECIES: DUF4169 family protein [unclassified Sphingomonas]|uniref:DUF4169 family protein n=1 Tax=unclassified Sphingomonas TaxID=196159 RepID=UPI0006F646B3|nr:MULTISPECIES: DUF4169 family protein [unclassified Sphingomonas]KQX20117.1 hypothetical protein ASD17_09505 [Sphingomonas sp. Root1294]KQY67367.1 hypothetical protein ASD39_09565 [Sphingomonas sp. Root50]KRB90745.1 hypothetical protein ASE22_10575 [Sphingomonas sp. Root720]